jgi:hypothetical protein
VACGNFAQIADVINCTEPVYVFTAGYVVYILSTYRIKGLHNASQLVCLTIMGPIVLQTVAPTTGRQLACVGLMAGVVVVVFTS